MQQLRRYPGVELLLLNRSNDGENLPGKRPDEVALPALQAFERRAACDYRDKITGRELAIAVGMCVEHREGLSVPIAAVGPHFADMMRTPFTLPPDTGDGEVLDAFFDLACRPRLDAEEQLVLAAFGSIGKTLPFTGLSINVNDRDRKR